MKIRKGLFGAVAALAVMATGVAADTVRVGVLAPFSGPNATWGQQFRMGLDIFQATHGTEAGGRTVEFVYRDLQGPNPDQARALAQELLVRDGVEYLAGLVFTPNALALAQLSEQAETPTVIFNAATSIITQESPYFVRSSFTLWQVTGPVAEWAHAQGKRRVITAVSDYGPGIDGETAFRTIFTELGGEVVDSVRMPLTTSDFAPFMQRIRDSGAEAVYAFLPAGPATFAFTKAYNDAGLRELGIDFLGTGETDETTLEALGDPALGLVTAYHYSDDHPSDMNRDFMAAVRATNPQARANLAAVGAYDGAYLLYRMIESGERGLAAIEAVKGHSWESPRGPLTLDPDTRHVTQNVYLRRVERDEATGLLVNREFDVIEAVPDLGLVAR